MDKPIEINFRENDKNIKHGVKIIENSFKKISNDLFGSSYQPIKVDGPLDTKSWYSVFIYEAFIKTSENIVNNVNQVNYWSNSALASVSTNSLLLVALTPPRSETKRRVEEYNLIVQTNKTLSLLVSIFKDITIFKNYVLALKEVYEVRYTESLTEYIEKIQGILLANFKAINKNAKELNGILGNDYIGQVELFDDDLYLNNSKMIKEVKSLNFLYQPYPLIANKFISDFKINFKNGIIL